MEGYILSGATLVFAAGSAWGAVKVGMNGTKDRLKHLEEEHEGIVDRLARVETKIDMLLERRD